MPGINLLSYFGVASRRAAEHVQDNAKTSPSQREGIASTLKSVNNAPTPMRSAAGETQQSSTRLTGIDDLAQYHILNKYFEDRHVQVLGSKLELRNKSVPAVWSSQSQPNTCVLFIPDSTEITFSKNLNEISEILKNYEDKKGLTS